MKNVAPGLKNNARAKEIAKSLVRSNNPRNTMRFQKITDSNKRKAAGISYSQVMPGSGARFLSSTPGTVRIHHRELICTLNGTTADDFSRVYVIQPSNGQTFPWLSAIASQYETYTFNMLKFHYVPAVPTTYGGSVALAIDLDADDDPPVDIIQFGQYQHRIVGQAWDSFTIGIIGQGLQKLVKERYTRHADSTTIDVLVHDVGKLYLATLSNTDFNRIGMLEVEYDIVLRTPEPIKHDNPTQFRFLCAANGTIAKPMGLYANAVSSNTVNASGIPWSFMSISGGDRGISINKAGVYLVTVACYMQVSATEWDSAAKINDNFLTSHAWSGSGFTVIANYPQTDNLTDFVGGATDYIRIDCNVVLRINSPTSNWLRPTITNSGSGLTSGCTNYLSTKGCVVTIHPLGSYLSSPLLESSISLGETLVEDPSKENASHERVNVIEAIEQKECSPNWISVPKEETKEVSVMNQTLLKHFETTPTKLVGLPKKK